MLAHRVERGGLGVPCGRLARGLTLLTLAVAASSAQAAPTVTSIAPSAGNIGGATPITVTGTGFVSGATVSIGGVACTQIKVLGSTTIIAVTGAHSAGAVTVQVCNPPADCSVSGPAYTFNATIDFIKTTKAQFETAGATFTNLVTTGLDSTLRWTNWTPTTGGSGAAGTYYYAVTAVNAAGESRRSAPSAGAVIGGANNAVNLDWTPIPGALQYKLYRTTVPGTFGATSYLATVTAPPYKDVSLATAAGSPPAANGATGDVFLAFGGTPAASFTSGPSVTGIVDFGAFSLLRADGTFLIVHGGSGPKTSIYDPVANTMVAGPTLTGTADRGTHACRRPNGTWLIVHGDRTTGSSIYDPVANTMVAGPALSGTVGWGGGSIKRPDGKYLIIHADNSTGTTVYDPVANTAVAGPVLTGNADEAALSVARPDGKHLICRGNNGTATTIYDPVAGTMVAGPALTGGLSRGGHALQRPDGRWLIVQGGNSSGTTIYDPVANTCVAGPATTANVQDGGHSLQRADGKFLVLHGKGASSTSLYDPVANTMAAGPATLNSINDGAHTLQRYDGRYLVFNGNSNTTMLYDAGWLMTGQYVSEAISPAALNFWNTLGWVRDSDDTLTVYVRTAITSGGLASATWRAATNGGSIGAAANEKWLQLRADVARALPRSQPTLDDLWGRWRAEFRQWPRPLALSLTANYTPTTLSVATSKTSFVFGTQNLNTWVAADSSTLTNDGTVSESLHGQISTFTDGGVAWVLSPVTNGVEQVRAQYSTASAAGPWTDVSAYATSFPIAGSVGVGSTLKFYFRIQMPTSTASTSLFSSTLTVTAQ